jgi:hypothetical protein
MDMEEGAPLMDDVKSQKSNKSVKSVKSAKSQKKATAVVKPKGRPTPTTADYCECCCCAFQVHDPLSREQRCCFCFPLKAGLFWLVIITFLVVIFECVMLVLMSKNIYYSGWYVFFEFLALTPAFVAVAFCIYYLSDDTKESRSRLQQSFLLVGLAILLMGLVSIIYITGIYEPDRVYNGYGQSAEEGNEEYHYTSETKKEFVYEQIITVLALGGFFLLGSQSAQIYANSYDVAE